MFLHAAIVPPTAVLEAVASALGSAEQPTPAAPPPNKGLLGRMSGRHDDQKGSTLVSAPRFEAVSVEQMHLPIAVFGNLTTGDASKLAQALRTAAVSWPLPTVHLTGGTVDEAARERTLCATVEGDVAELVTLARGVTQCAQRLGFRFDRRVFKPLLSVATVSQATPARVMSLLNVLEAFQSDPWTVSHVSLLKRTFSDDSSDSTELFRIPLGPDARAQS
jgi:2'-5' RNA ligase